MTHQDCAILGCNGCKNCVLYPETGGSSCWDYADANPEEVAGLVQAQKERYLIDGIHRILCPSCNAITSIHKNKVFYDAYLDSNAVRCKKCGIKLEVNF